MIQQEIGRHLANVFVGMVLKGMEEAEPGGVQAIVSANFQETEPELIPFVVSGVEDIIAELLESEKHITGDSDDADN